MPFAEKSVNKCEAYFQILTDWMLILTIRHQAIHKTHFSGNAARVF